MSTISEQRTPGAVPQEGVRVSSFLQPIAAPSVLCYFAGGGTLGGWARLPHAGHGIVLNQRGNTLPSGYIQRYESCTVREPLARAASRPV